VERSALREPVARLQEMLAAEVLTEDEIIADFKRWLPAGVNEPAKRVGA
jgi:hypothetical protein